MLKIIKEIAWFTGAAKEFKKFPEEAKAKCITALNFAAAGEKTEIAKPMKGLGTGVFEIAVKYHRDAYRTIYAMQIDEKIWVVHAFKKKSKTGIKTPKQEIDLIKSRIKFLKEQKK